MNKRANERTTKVFKMAAVTVRALFSNTEANNNKKRCVFRRALKTDSEDAKVTCWGRLFQVSVAAIGNVRSSTVERHVRWTIIDDDGADGRRASEFTIRWSSLVRWQVPVRVDICKQGWPTWNHFTVGLSASGVDGAVEWHAHASMLSRLSERQLSSQNGPAAQNRRECKQGHVSVIQPR